MDTTTPIAAGYVRLSKEDEAKQQESESIQNQRALIAGYAAERGWRLHDIYVDEDYSGVDSMRPAFNRLLADAESGRFNIVVCKSQSRFTRDMEAVEKYLHHKFLLWGVRFISITDNADTLVKGNKKARQINGLINEWYLEDLSENVRTVLEHKRKMGQYIGSFPVYGYRKDPGNHNHLVPDPVAAEVVRQIYALYLQGMGKTQIARRLNEQGIPNPARYKQHNSGYVSPSQGYSSQVWSRTTVGRILRDRMYTGDLVQGKRRKVSYKSKQLVSLPEQEWIVVPNAHEAIVDRETFEAAQRARDQRTRPSGSDTGSAHALSGKVRCMACGSAMHKYRMTYKGRHTYYLRCKLFGAHPDRCTGHSIRLDRLETELAGLLREQIAIHYRVRPAREYLENGRRNQKQQAIQRERGSLRAEIQRREAAVRALYLDKASGLVTARQFTEYTQGYRQEIEEMKARLSALDTQLQSLPPDPRNAQGIDQLIAPRSLTRELALTFIDYVEIGEKDPAAKTQEIRVHWLF